MKYEYKEVKVELSMFSSNLTKHRGVINEMADKGYRYVGWIPTEFFNNGRIEKLDLVFEKED